jgi:amino acid transporter
MRGRIELTFYVAAAAGMALGTSSFTMIAGLFQVVPSFWVFLGVLLAGLFCILISLSIAELAGMFPSSPAIRTYFKVAFSDRTSLVLIYLYLIFIVMVAGVESYMFALVTRAIFPGAPPLGTVVGLILAIMIANLLGLGLPRGLQMLTAFGCIAIILAVGAMSFAAPRALEVGDGKSSLALLPAVTALAVFLFTGFEWVTPLGLRPQSYQRYIPLAMPLSLVALIVTYGVFVAGMAARLPRSVIVAQSVPQVPYFRAVLGPMGLFFAAAMSVSAVVATFNAGVMGGARLINALSRERKLPRWCGTMALRTGAPVGAVLLLGGLAIVSAVVVVSFRLQLLAAGVGATLICFIYAAYMLAVLRLRKIAPERKRPFRTPVHAAVQWTFLLVLPLMGIASLFAQPGMGFRPTAGVILASALAYALSSWSLRRSAVAPQPAVRGQAEPPGESAKSAPGTP